MIAGLRDWYDRVTASQDRHPLVGPLQAVVRWTIVFYNKLKRDRAFVRAGAMAYATLIALVPFLLLVFGILGATGMLEANLDTIETVLFGTFMGDIPEVREFLLPGLIKVDLTGLGVVGVVGLLFVASRLMLMIEAAYCDIYGVPVERPFLSRILNIYFAVTAMPLLALAVIITSQNTLSQVPVEASWLPLSIVSPVMLFGVFLGALKLFPSTRVRWRPAMVGAAFSSLLVTALGRVFPWYVSVFGSDDPLRVIYGSVGIIPVFLLWLYCMWMFVLLGVEVAYVIQNYTSLLEAEKEEWERTRSTLRAVDVTVAVEVAVRIASRFVAGQGLTEPTELAATMSISPRAMWRVLGVLEEDGIVVRVEDAFTMARPPSSVTIAQVVGGWRRRTSVRNSTQGEVADRVHNELLPTTDGSLEDAASRWLAEESAVPAVALVVDDAS